MTTFADHARAAARATVIVAVGAVMGLHAQTQEDSARRRLESGRAFLKSQNYGEALKDFQVVVKPMNHSVADDALARDSDVSARGGA